MEGLRLMGETLGYDGGMHQSYIVDDRAWVAITQDRMGNWRTYVRELHGYAPGGPPGRVRWSIAGRQLERAVKWARTH
jgi:hypothetical protein